MEHTNYILTQELEQLKTRTTILEELLKTKHEKGTCDICQKEVHRACIFTGALFNEAGDEVKCYICNECLNVA